MLVYVIAALAVLPALAIGAWAFMVNNVETPDYKLVSAHGAIEVRDYPRMTVAQVATRGDRWPAVNQGFRPLANYIFASNRDGGKIAMTAPVTQQRKDEHRADWIVRFIMPSEHSLEELPRPGEARVKILEVPESRRIAIRFSGVATGRFDCRPGTPAPAMGYRKRLRP